jgi:regulator of protease activity HflC (stomatin/prohibitin superfamily)
VSAESSSLLPETGGAWAQAAKLSFRFLFILVGLLALAWAFSNVQRVPADSRAVILRFGQVVAEHGAGLVIAWPRPIEQVLLLPSAGRLIQYRIARFEPAANFGSSFGATLDISQDPRNNVALLLTGDGGVVHLGATLFCEITDPAAYVVAASHVAGALERLFLAGAVSVAASRDLDSILVTRSREGSDARENEGASRERLRSDLVRAVNRRLDDLAASGAGVGIRVSRVDVSAALPLGAKEAFDHILTVTQSADKEIASARTDAAARALAASKEARRILTEAEAAAEERTTHAKIHSAPIVALARRMAEPSGRALLDRVYYDRISLLLRKAKEVDSVDPRSGARLLLPGPAPP